jgi:hypothetical protein
MMKSCEPYFDPDTIFSTLSVTPVTHRERGLFFWGKKVPISRCNLGPIEADKPSSSIVN